MKFINLSPMDYYFYRRQLYTIQFIFEYDGHLDVNFLENSLQTTLHCLPVAGSRIKIVSEREIQFKFGGSIPVYERRMSEDPDLDSIDDKSDFFKSVENIEGEPLVSFMLTKTNNKTYLGVSFSHMLGDGFSYFFFLKQLSKACLVKTKFETAFEDRNALSCYAKNQAHEFDFFKNTGYVIPRPEGPEKIKTEFTYYSNSDLQYIEKNICKGFSLNDYIMADLFKKYYHTIPPIEGQFLLRCPVDYRKRMGLPENYFGNAVRDAVSSFSASEANHFSVSEIAKKVRASIEAVNQQSVVRSLESLNSLRLQKGISAFESIGCPGLLVSNLSKLPISEIDLGLGSPVNFYHGSLNPRLAVILPNEDGVKVAFKKIL